MITEIENFKLKEFVTKPQDLIEEYLTILRYIKSTKTENDIFHMRLRDVENLKKWMEGDSDEDLLSAIALVQGCSEDEVQDYDIIKFFGVINSIKEQLDTIYSAEVGMMAGGYVNKKWEIVNGAERMAKFGIYNTLESLSGGDVTKYNTILDMKYSEVFTIIAMRKTASDLQYEMEQIKIESK